MEVPLYIKTETDTNRDQQLKLVTFYNITRGLVNSIRQSLINWSFLGVLGSFSNDDGDGGDDAG